jgi:hypothetical protein
MTAPPRKPWLTKSTVWRFAVWSCFAVATYFLWFDVFWAFHHHYALGVFSWLWLGGEDGFLVLPNPCGLPLTLGAWILALLLARHMTKPESEP